LAVAARPTQSPTENRALPSFFVLDDATLVDDPKAQHARSFAETFHRGGEQLCDFAIAGREVEEAVRFESQLRAA
jgi:hypothetical protein